jgi:hypothetical protein
MATADRLLFALTLAAVLGCALLWSHALGMLRNLPTRRSTADAGRLVTNGGIDHYEGKQ